MHSVTATKAGKIERDHREATGTGGLQMNAIEVLPDDWLFSGSGCNCWVTCRGSDKAILLPASLIHLAAFLAPAPFKWVLSRMIGSKAA